MQGRAVFSPLASPPAASGAPPPLGGAHRLRISRLPSAVACSGCAPSACHREMPPCSGPAQRCGRTVRAFFGCSRQLRFALSPAPRA
eukprot:6917042-Alexandrium_andersonii.AAC.1